jgi:hypothetical protein
MMLLCAMFISGGADMANAATNMTLPNGEPILRLPFPSGTVVLCEQGNCTANPKASHRLSSATMNCAYALDLTPSNQPNHTVAAAADGTVIQIYADSDPHDLAAGAGFGNQIKIDHGNGYFTFYAHLDKVLVKVGDHVFSGAEIGTVGSTGGTNNKHDLLQLHFSLHRFSKASVQPNTYLGVGESIPMHALIAADLNNSKDFKLLSSLEFVPSDLDFSSKGHLYGSENDHLRSLLIGEPPEELASKLSSAADALRKEIQESTTKVSK